MGRASSALKTRAGSPLLHRRPLCRTITVYGNGKQVRDVLWVEDLIDAYESAAQHIDIAAGQIYNVGGGPDNTISIWAEFGPVLERLSGRHISTKFAEWRPGDQTVYVSDIRKAQRELGWQPKVSLHEGLERLWRWVDANPEIFEPPILEPVITRGVNGRKTPLA